MAACADVVDVVNLNHAHLAARIHRELLRSRDGVPQTNATTGRFATCDIGRAGTNTIVKNACREPVSFTVAEYQGRTFSGSVEQVRLQSATTENVVN